MRSNVHIGPFVGYDGGGMIERSRPRLGRVTRASAEGPGPGTPRSGPPESANFPPPPDPLPTPFRPPRAPLPRPLMPPGRGPWDRRGTAPNEDVDPARRATRAARRRAW